MDTLSQIERLTPEHQLDQFSCEPKKVERWLKRHALRNQTMANSPISYVVHQNRRVVAYYSLVYGAVVRENCSVRVAEYMPEHHPVPVMRLVWIGVDKEYQRKGLGKALMKDAYLRTLSAAETAGLRAMVVDAIDDEAKMFYKLLGFEESPIGSRQLFLRLDDIRASIEAAGRK